MSLPGTEIPKISAAAGLALALYRRFRARVYLFDTEVEEVSPRDVVRTLLRIRADGGTCIGKVLETIKTLPQKSIHIVITDAIDNVSIELAREVASRYRVVFCLLPPAWSDVDWLRYFRVVEVRSLHDLVRAVTAYS